MGLTRQTIQKRDKHHQKLLKEHSKSKAIFARGPDTDWQADWYATPKSTPFSENVSLL